MTRSKKTPGSDETPTASSSASNENDITTTLLQLVIKVTEVLTKNADLQDQIRDLKDHIRDLKESNKCLTERIQVLEDASGEWSTKQRHFTAPLPDINALTSTVADELQGRKDKEMNLVILGLEERPVEATDENESADMAEAAEMRLVKDVLQSIDVTNPNITKVFRMGRRNTGRPRPVKVLCDDRASRSNILMNAKKLKNLPDGDRRKKVFIRADLTQLQRDQDYIRRQTTRQQPGRPENSYTTRNLETVHNRNATPQAVRNDALSN
jgi:cell division septum initiation protein DivIVA